ncbi:hypothetical protein B0H14DRAFT_3573372 [Mycena olivaceomarginata]|nr:hypothetical protein B0H14DRAFT_3573372 [Mycena olivaceomarginata]
MVSNCAYVPFWAKQDKSGRLLIDGRLRLFLHAITSLYSRYFGCSENSPWPRRSAPLHSANGSQLPASDESLRMRRFRYGHAAEARILCSRFSRLAAYITSFFSARYQGLDRVPTAGFGITPHLLCAAAADTHHHASLGSLRPLHVVSPLASTTEALMPIHPQQPSTGGLGF